MNLISTTYLQLKLSLQSPKKAPNLAYVHPSPLLLVGFVIALQPVFDMFHLLWFLSFLLLPTFFSFYSILLNSYSSFNSCSSCFNLSYASYKICFSLFLYSTLFILYFLYTFAAKASFIRIRSTFILKLCSPPRLLEKFIFPLSYTRFLFFVGVASRVFL